MPAEVSEMWWSLKQWKEESQEHLFAKELGLLGTAPGGLSSLSQGRPVCPLCYLGQVVWSPWATALFCNTEDISLLLPTREGTSGSNEQPGRCHSWSDGLEHADPGQYLS